jgi:putative transposase
VPRQRKLAGPFRYFNSSPEMIRLVVMMYVRLPLSPRNVEDLLFERGIDICHTALVAPFWTAVRGRRAPPAVKPHAGLSPLRWHLDEMYVKLNGEMVYLWRAGARFSRAT